MAAEPGEHAEWQLQTPWPSRGAIALLQVRGAAAQIDSVVQKLGLRDIAPGRMLVRQIAEIDRCIVNRFDDRTLLIFPHAGRAIIEQLIAALESAGVVRRTTDDPIADFPEAASEIEARALAMIARAASPLAIDLLLAQPVRWARAKEIGEVDRTVARALHRLIDPPLVAAIGPPNVGKSSLLNALAGRSVSIVADEPGTTRDHVGAMIDLGGLVVRWMDCPGFEPGGRDPIGQAAQQAAFQVAASADLVVSCGDQARGFLAAPAAETPKLVVGLRSDLGQDERTPLWVSVKTGVGLDDLIGLVRETVVPSGSLNDPRAWRFWDVATRDGA